MENLLDLIKLFSNKEESPKVTISKELREQYPYGEFPIRYTKSGQETLRKHSENRFSYNEDKIEQIAPQGNNLSLETILPLIQTLSSSKKNNENMIEVFSKLLFKDNPQINSLLKLFQNKKSINIKSSDDFPDTNKVEISSLNRIQ